MAKSKNYRKFRIVAAAIGLGLALTYVMYVFVERTEREAQIQRFDGVADRTAELIRANVLAKLSVVGELRTPASANVSFKREDFTNLSTKIVDSRPDIISLSWAPRVKNEERPFFETTIREEGFTSFQITEITAETTFEPASLRSDYYPQTFTYPFKERDLERLGLNLGSLSDVEAVLRAAESSEKMQVITASEQRTLGNRQSTLTVYEPVFRIAPTQSKKELAGFIIGVFDAQRLLEAATSPIETNMSAAFFHRDGNRAYLYHRLDGDTSATAEPLVFETLIAEQGARVTAVRTFEVGGRLWDVVLSPKSGYEVDTTILIVQISLLGFTLTTILIIGLLFVEGEFVSTDLARKRVRELGGKLDEEHRARLGLENEVVELNDTLREYIFQNTDLKHQQAIEGALRAASERESERLRGEIDELQERLLDATEQFDQGAPTDEKGSFSDALEGEQASALREEIALREKKIQELEQLKKGRLKVTETEEYRALQARFEDEHRVAVGLLAEVSKLKSALEEQSSSTVDETSNDSIPTPAALVDPLDQEAFEELVQERVAELLSERLSTELGEARRKLEAEFEQQISQQLSALNDQVALQSSTISSQVESMTRLGHDLAREREELGALREQHTSLKSALHEKNEKLLTLSSRGDSSDESDDIYRTALREQLEEYEARIAELETELESRTSQLEETREHAAELEAQAVFAAQSLPFSSEDNSDSTTSESSQYATLTARIEELELQLEEARSVAPNRGELDEGIQTPGNNESLNTELEEHRARLASLEEQLQLEQLALAELQKENESLKAEIESRTTTPGIAEGVGEAEQNLARIVESLEKELESTKTERDEATTRASSLSEQLSSLQEEGQKLIEREREHLAKLELAVDQSVLERERAESQTLRKALEELAERVGTLREESLKEAETLHAIKREKQELLDRLDEEAQKLAQTCEEHRFSLAQRDANIEERDNHIELLKSQLAAERTSNESTLDTARRELQGQITRLEAVNEDQRAAIRDLQKEYGELLRAMEREKADHFNRELDYKKQINALKSAAEDAELAFERCTVQERERIQRERLELEAFRVEVARELEQAQLSRLKSEEQLSEITAQLNEERESSDTLIRELSASLETEKLSAAEREADLEKQLNSAIASEEEVRVAFERFKEDSALKSELERSKSEHAQRLLNEQLSEARENIAAAHQQISQLTNRMAREQAEAEATLAEVTDSLELQKQELEVRCAKLSEELSSTKNLAEQARLSFEQTKTGLLESAQRARESHESVKSHLTLELEQVKETLTERESRLKNLTQQYDEEKSAAQRKYQELLTKHEEERSASNKREGDLTSEVASLKTVTEGQKRIIEQLNNEASRRKQDFDAQRQTLNREIEKARQRIIRKKEQIDLLSSQLSEEQALREVAESSLAEKQSLFEKINEEKGVTERNLAELYAKLAAERASFALRETVLGDEISTLRSKEEETSSALELLKAEIVEREKAHEDALQQLTAELELKSQALLKSTEEGAQLSERLKAEQKQAQTLLEQLNQNLAEERSHFAEREAELSDEIATLRVSVEEGSNAFSKLQESEAERFRKAEEEYQNVRTSLSSQLESSQRILAERAAQIFSLTTELETERSQSRLTIEQLSSSIELERAHFGNRETELSDEITSLRAANEELEVAFDRYRRESFEQAEDQRAQYAAIESQLTAELDQERLRNAEHEERIEALGNQLTQQRSASELRIKSINHAHEREITELTQRQAALNHQVMTLREALQQSDSAFESYKEEEQRRSLKRKEQYDLYREQLNLKLEQARETLAKKEERLSQITTQLSLEKTLSAQRLQTLRDELTNSFELERNTFLIRQDELESEMNALRDLVAQSELTIQSLQDDIDSRAEQLDSSRLRLSSELESLRLSAQSAEERVALLTSQLEDERRSSEQRLSSLRRELTTELERRARTGTDQHRALLQLQRDYLEATRARDQLRRELEEREAFWQSTSSSHIDRDLYEAERSLVESLRTENSLLQERVSLLSSRGESTEMTEALEQRVREQEELIEHLQSRLQVSRSEGSSGGAASAQLEVRLRESNGLIARLKEERDAERLRGEQLEELVRELRVQSRGGSDSEMVRKLQNQIREMEQVQDEQLTLIASLSKRGGNSDGRSAEVEERYREQLQQLRADLEAEKNKALDELGAQVSDRNALIQTLKAERDELASRLQSAGQRSEGSSGGGENRAVLDKFREKLTEQTEIIQNLQDEVWKLRQVSDQSRAVQHDLERKVAERAAALAASEARYKTLTQITPAGIFYTDTEGRVVFANEHFVQLCGVPFDQLRGEGWIQLIHPDDRALVARKWKKAVRDRERFSAEFRIEYYDGSLKWVVAQAALETSQGSDQSGFVGTIMDTTERKRAGGSQTVGA